MLPSIKTSAKYGIALTGSSNTGAKLFALGGKSVGGELNEAELYERKTSVWSALPPMNKKRYCASACAGMEHDLFIFGGESH